MDKVGIGIGMVVGATLVASGFVWSYEKSMDRKQQNALAVEMAAAATVTIDQAIKTALANFSGKVIEAELKKTHDTTAKRDRTVWAVEIVTAEQDLMAVHVDAESGSVIDTEEKMIGKKQDPESKPEPKHAKKS
ncbi:MAG TPA: PepSY domain-containing protein [Nitrospiraceae bacterium]|nr:PepSY domain-containing protein [Nitrospiraceae bacterium]